MNIPLTNNNNNPTTTKEVAVMSTPTVSNTIIKWHDEDAFWQCSIDEYKQIYTEGIRFAVCEKMGDIYKLESDGNLHAYVYSGELLAQLIKDYHNESEEENMKPQPKEKVAMEWKDKYVNIGYMSGKYRARRQAYNEKERYTKMWQRKEHLYVSQCTLCKSFVAWNKTTRQIHLLTKDQYGYWYNEKDMHVYGKCIKVIPQAAINPQEEVMKPQPQPQEQIMKPQPIPKEKVMKVSDMPLLDGKFVIAGTGSRSLILDEEKMDKVEDYLIELLYQAKAKHGDNLVVISGMAEGFDEALARSAMCVGITLIAAIPNKGYSAYYWRDNSQLKIDRMDTFQDLAGYAHRSGGVHYVCGKDIYVNGKHSNFVRNEWMADRADVVWVYNPTSRGTAQCYNYCRTNGIKTFIINPEGGNVKNTDKPVEPVNPTEKENIMPVIPDNPNPKEKEKPMNPIIEQAKREVAMYEPGKTPTFFHGIVKYNNQTAEGGNMRVITTMPLTEMDESVEEEFKQGGYSFAFLDTFFPQGYRVEVRDLDQSETAMPRDKALLEDDITPDTVIRWSTADNQFNIIVNDNNGWLDAFNKIGLIIGNSKKFAKRSQEFARQSCMYGLYQDLDVEIMDPADLGVDEKYVDGISAVSRTIMVNMIENNQNVSDEWKESMIRRVESGKMSIVQLRVLTPHGLIKGNAIVLPDKMMNGYDIRTFTPNVKAEIKTTGWYWATAEASYGKLPLMSDDLTLAIYRDVMGVIDPWLMLSTTQNALNELVHNYKNGSDSDWRKEVAMNIDNEDDMNPNKKSMIKRIDQLADKLNEIGLGVESSQLLMYLKARGVAMMFGILDGNGTNMPLGDAVTQRGTGTRMPVPFAYRAHIMTREVLEIFGYKFNNKGMQGFYHDKTHCFVVPGEFFVENYPNHGGPDLDDSINVMIRDFVNAQGKRSYKALLMRNPNDFGEWSAIPVAPSEVEHCYHTYGNVPTVIEAELRAKVEQLDIMLKNDRINYTYDALPGASGLTIGDVYSIKDEVRMRESASAMPGGTGATVLPKMLTYAITGEVITNQLVSNEQIIDAVQQGLGTPADMKLITDSGDDFYRHIRTWLGRTDGRIDQYWTRTKRVPMRVGLQFGFWGANYSFVADKEDSPLLQTMLVREAIVREAYRELLEWANAPHMPACIANMAMDTEERKLAATEFAQITEWFYAVTASGTTKDWAKKLVETLEKSDKEKGEAYTDRKILRLFRQGFIAKTARPMGNHDKWLFVVNPELDQLPIDWLIRAYQRFIIS